MTQSIKQYINIVNGNLTQLQSWSNLALIFNRRPMGQPRFRTWAAAKAVIATAMVAMNLGF
jgi:hypothetical protein